MSISTESTHTLPGKFIYIGVNYDSNVIVSIPQLSKEYLAKYETTTLSALNFYGKSGRIFGVRQ